MALTPGTKLGPYEITGTLGAGGMGEVYRARDTNLKRDVAIKVLPASFASEADRLTRFQREAEVLASLNHPNIAHIYGLERSDETTALVMELVEGPTLADRIAQRPIAADEALRIAMQVADALEAAHTRGIVHRDLKPANIKLTSEGIVKVLDFGIAKALDNRTSTDNEAAALTTPAMTQAGLVLGTAAYMSPEQARGKPVDQRADIWAFGCLLYEMLTGQPAFAGEDVLVTLARVLDRDTNMDSLPGIVPPTVRHTITLCLEKDPRKRVADIRDVKLALEGRFEAGFSGHAEAADVRLPVWQRPLPLGAGMLVAGAALAGLAALILQPEPGPRPLNRFSYSMPDGMRFRRQGENVIAAAPDGRHFVMNTVNGLYLRPMDTLEGRIIAGTEEDLDTPFFAPDSQSIGYWTPAQQIKRIGISGGAPVVIAEGVANPLGASWEPDGTILIANEQGIVRVSADGGAPEVLFERAGNERFQAPQLLPDGDHVLFSLNESAEWNRARIVAQSIASGERTVLIEGGNSARYIDSGHIVYALGDDLFAMAFDADLLTLTGRVVPLVQGVSRALDARAGLANYAVTGDGTLIYVAGFDFQSSFSFIPSWVDRDGREEALGLEDCVCITPRLSPDGRRIAFVQIADLNFVSGDVWIWTIASRTFTRLTFEEGARSAVWSPDGQQLAYGGPGGIYVRRADGTGAVRQLLESAAEPFSWSADGEIVYSFPADGNRDIGVLSADGDPMPRTLLATPFDEGHLALSPNGRWLAYESDESGHDEIYVRPFPEVDGGRWQVSGNGGREPQWSQDSSALHFVGSDAMMTAVIVTGPSFVFGTPESRFDLSNYVRNDLMPGDYAVAPDGEHFLMFLSPYLGGGGDEADIVIVENWVEELKRLVPVEGKQQ